MTTLRTGLLVPIAMFVGGVALIAFAVASGDADVSLVLIIPVFSGSSATFLLGVMLLIGSFLTGFVMTAMGSEEQIEGQTHDNAQPGTGQEGRRSDFGGFVLIGPIPIAFGSNKRVALAMLVIGVVLAVLMLGLLLAL